MSSHTRRSILGSLVGLSVVGGVSTTQARPQPTFESVWNKTIIESREFGDSSRLPNGALVVAGVKSHPTVQSSAPDVVAIDDSGNREWVWNWPEDRSDSLDYVRALAPADDGGLFFAGPTNEDRSEALLIGKLDAERNVEWHITPKEYHYYYGLVLVRTSSSRLTIIGYEVSPEINRTHVFGLDTDTRSVSWERDAFPDTSMLSATVHQQGCVVTGETSKGGWTARFTPDGDTDWERTFSKPELVLTDVTTSADGDVVAIGHRINDYETIEIPILDSDGTLNARQVLEFQPLSVPHDPQIVSVPSGGYVCSWSYGDRSELFIGKLTTEGTLTYGNHIEPWNSTSRPVLLDIELVNEAIVLLGNTKDGESEPTLTWGVEADKTVETRTLTETPSQTATDTLSPTQTPTPTGTPSPTDVPEPTETETPTTSTSSANGPGFGVVGSLLGVAGVGYFVSSRSQEESD